MESSNHRAEGFPVGLRVLVVDDDPAWLKILEKMLKKCSYEVTTCGLARVALDMLRERRDRFDIVISDVNMPDMDGFKLLEHVGLEMDLPVIMMSVDGETSRVMKGVQHGACDYLLKPVRTKELKNIWQHVFRKRINEIKDIEHNEGIEDFQLVRNKSEFLDGRQISYGSDLNSPKKRKDVTGKDHVDHDAVDHSSHKKARVVWTVDLHQKFVDAVNQIGFEKVGPKKILDLMDVPGLTRENVASHLQKYRLYLSRLQKQNEGVTRGGVILPECGSNDLMGNFSYKNSSGSPLNNPNNLQNYSGKRICEKSTSLQADALNFKSVASQADLKPFLANGNIGTPNIKPTIYSNGTHSPKGMTQNVEQKMQRSYASDNYIWNGGIAPMQFGKQPKDERYCFSSLLEYQHIHQLGAESAGDYLSSTMSPATTMSWAESCTFPAKTANHDCRSDGASGLPMMSSATDSIPIKVEPRDENSVPLVPEINGCSITSHYPDQYLIDRIECTSQKINSTNETTICSSNKDILSSIQDYNSLENLSFAHMDMLQYNLSPLAELSGNMYEGSQLDYEYNFDWMDFPTIGNGLLT